MQTQYTRAVAPNGVVMSDAEIQQRIESMRLAMLALARDLQAQTAPPSPPPMPSPPPPAVAATPAPPPAGVPPSNEGATSYSLQQAPGAKPPTDQEQFVEALVLAHGGGTAFTSASDLRTTMSKLQVPVEVSQELAESIWRTTANTLPSANPEDGTLTPELGFGVLASLIYDSGTVTTAGQTTPGILDITQTTEGQKLVLGADASAFDRLRFNWNPGPGLEVASPAALAANFDGAVGAGAAGLSVDEQNGLLWLAKTYGSSTTLPGLSWSEVSNLVARGIIRLDQVAPGGSRGPVVDVDRAIQLAFLGVNQYERETNVSGDIQSNPWIQVKNTATPPSWYSTTFTDDGSLSIDLQYGGSGITVDFTQLGLFRNATRVPDGMGPAQLTGPELLAGIQGGTFKYELTSDGQLVLELADPRTLLANAITVAPEFGGGKTIGDAATLQTVLNLLIGRQYGDNDTNTLPRFGGTLTLEATRTLIAEYGTEGTINGVQLNQALAVGGLQVSVDPITKRLNLVVSAPQEVGAPPGLGRNGTFTGTVAAVRTPVNTAKTTPFNQNLFDDAQLTTVDFFVDRYYSPETAFQCGAFDYYARDQLDGTGYNVFQALHGTNAFIKVASLDDGAAIKASRTYEWDVGATGQAKYDGTGVADIGLNGYTRLKVFDQFWVYETKPKTAPGENTSFRSRTYFPNPVATGQLGQVGDPNAAGAYWVENRWGLLQNPFQQANPTTPAILTEWGVQVSLSASSDLTDVGSFFKAAADRDWEAAGTRLAQLPAGSVTGASWNFGLFQLKNRANQAADKILGVNNTNGTNNTSGDDPRWYQSVPASILRFIGDNWQHTAFVATLGGSAFFDAGTKSTASAGDADGNSDTGLPPGAEALNAQLDALAKSPQAQALTNVIGALQTDLFKTSLSGLGSAVGPIFDAINNALLLTDVAKALKGCNISDVANAAGLDDDQKETAFALIMEEATRLTLEASAPEPDPTAITSSPFGGSTLPGRESLFLLPGETVDNYVLRLLGNIKNNLGQAARNVLLNEDNLTDIFPECKYPAAPTSTEPGGGGGGGGGAAGAGGGSGIFGAIAGTVAVVAAATGAVLAVAAANSDPDMPVFDTGDSEVDATLAEAYDVLVDANALLVFLRDGGTAPVVAIPVMVQRCMDVIVKLNDLADNNLNEETQSAVDQTIDALNDVVTTLGLVSESDGDIKDQAVNSIAGREDGWAQGLPDEVVDNLIDKDPTSVRELIGQGVGPEEVGSLLDDFPDVSPEEWAAPGYRQGVQDSRDKFGADQVNEALQVGFTPQQILTAGSSVELGGVVGPLASDIEGGTLFETVDGSLAVGWTLSDVYRVFQWVIATYPSSADTPEFPVPGAPDAENQLQLNLANVLVRLELEEVQDEAFWGRVTSGDEFSPTLAILRARYWPLIPEDKRDDADYLYQLNQAEIRGLDGQDAIDYANENS